MRAADPPMRRSVGRSASGADRLRSLSVIKTVSRRFRLCIIISLENAACFMLGGTAPRASTLIEFKKRATEPALSSSTSRDAGNGGSACRLSKRDKVRSCVIAGNSVHASGYFTYREHC